MLLISLLTGLGAVLLSVLFHYELLTLTARQLERRNPSPRWRVVLGVTGVVGAHLVSISAYALLYYAAHETAFPGRLGGEFDGSARDYLYFSLMSFTTLGVGDVKAIGGLRIVSGLQALLGFVLIGWSASFTYVAAKSTWEAD